MNRNCEGLQHSFPTASLNKMVKKMQISVPIQANWEVFMSCNSSRKTGVVSFGELLDGQISFSRLI